LSNLELKPPEGVLNGVPFFSPDSQWLGYMEATSGVMRKVALTGGAPTKICTQNPGFSGVTWASPDEIYFVPDTPGGIARVSAAGGEPVEVVKIELDKGRADAQIP
jgi:hypothetical protein